jgi:hypothetical protein
VAFQPRRCYDLVRKLALCRLGEFDLLPAALLEGGDDLPERLALLVVIALLPPHH